jgi:hypothetical protein
MRTLLLAIGKPSEGFIQRGCRGGGENGFRITVFFHRRNQRYAVAKAIKENAPGIAVNTSTINPDYKFMLAHPPPPDIVPVLALEKMLNGLQICSEYPNLLHLAE